MTILQGTTDQEEMSTSTNRERTTGTNISLMAVMVSGDPTSWGQAARTFDGCVLSIN